MKIVTHKKSLAGKIGKTVCTTLVLLLFFFAQGAVAVVNQLEGMESALVRGSIIWGAALIAFVFFLIKDRNLKVIGFCRPRKNAAKSLFYYLPLIVIALAAFVGGVSGEWNSLIAANIFLTIGVGFTEEIYFRGIICKLWMDRSAKSAILISSVLFGACHLMNVMGGASFVETLLQICFAFVYGIVFALIFILTESILPCILLHAFHDFCAFMGAELSTQMNVWLGAFQFVALFIYVIVVVKKNREFSFTT